MINDSLKKILAVAAVCLAAAATVLLAAYAWRAIAGTPATLTVSGQGKVKYTPDIADVDVAVITKGVDPAAVQAQNDAKMTAVVSYLKTKGVKDEDITTTSYNLYPDYKQGPNVTDTSVIVGYTLNQGVRFRVRDVATVGMIVGGLSQTGVNTVQNIGFSLSDERLDALGIQAKQQGIAKAQAEFAALKTTLGFRRAHLVSVGQSVVYPMYQQSYRTLGMGAADASSAPSPIQVGTGEITAPVTLTYEIR